VAFCELFLRRDIKSEIGISVRKVVYCELFHCWYRRGSGGRNITSRRRKDEVLSDKLATCELFFPMGRWKGM